MNYSFQLMHCSLIDLQSVNVLYCQQVHSAGYTFHYFKWLECYVPIIYILYLSCLTELLNYIIVLFVIHWLFSYFPIHHSTSIFFSIPIQNILATISRISLVRDLASPNIVKLAFLRVDIKVRYVLWHSLLPESLRDNFSRSHTFEYEILITSENTPRYCT